MAVNMPLPPPTSALPQLPVSKLRGPSTTPEVSHISSASTATPKLALKTPSRVQKPPSTPAGSHATSSPSIPTLRSTSAHPTQSLGQDEAGNKEVRRSVSIANFPQPPKVPKVPQLPRKTGVESKFSSAAYYSLREPSRDTGASEPQTGSLRPKRLKTRPSNNTLGQIDSMSPTPTLLDGSGNSKAVQSVGSGTRRSNDLASLRSPDQSRTSSAQGSYSTSATTFEEADNRRGRDGLMGYSGGSESKKRHSGKEGKENVIVSVRLRPDAGGDLLSNKDWLVDRRQSLVTYRGREGGDYIYGKQSHSFEVFYFAVNGLDRRLYSQLYGLLTVANKSL